MAGANISGSSVEDDDVFSTQFAALLKPIRELTSKHGCWELNIADKLEEYVHYIQGLDIEVNVNGEPMKLDFAKAAMVVQNSVQIYSKKVDDLWMRLQEVIDAVTLTSNQENPEDGSNPVASKLIRRNRKRHQKEDVNLLEATALKFRKLNSKLKKKVNPKELKKTQTLPYEILQLEEVIGSQNSLKIKLYTLSNEHLGYPSDLRANFPFDPATFFLKIHHSSLGVVNENIIYRTIGDISERNEASPRKEISATGPPLEDPDDQPPNLNWDDDHGPPSDGEEMPPEDNGTFNNVAEMPRERMQLRRQAEAPVLAHLSNNNNNNNNEEGELIDPWRGMEPYSDDEIAKKPCGPPTKFKIPLALQEKPQRKRKEVGKDLAGNEDSIIGIDEYLGNGRVKKNLKYGQPDNEFWEDFVLFTRATSLSLKKQTKVQPGGAVRDNGESADEDDEGDNNDADSDRDVATPLSPGPIMNDDDFLADNMLNSPGGSPVRNLELDESKQFFELVQQFMTEYTASAKEFVHSTESTRRVQAWHDMIKPRLLEAESRRDFDIHVYGSNILNSFGPNAPVGSLTTLSHVMAQEPKHELARYFLAALQLANTYNIEITLQQEMSKDGIEMKLLSHERHHEHMEVS